MARGKGFVDPVPGEVLDEDGGDVGLLGNGDSERCDVAAHTGAGIHLSGKCFGEVFISGREGVEAVRGCGQVGFKGGQLHKTEVGEYIVISEWSEKGLGEDALGRLGEDVNVTAGISVLECSHNGGGPSGVAEAVRGDKV